MISTPEGFITVISHPGIDCDVFRTTLKSSLFVTTPIYGSGAYPMPFGWLGAVQNPLK